MTIPTNVFFYNYNCLTNNKKFLVFNENLNKHICQPLTKCISFDCNKDSGIPLTEGNLRDVSNKLTSDFKVFLKSIPSFNLRKTLLKIYFYSLLRTPEFKVLFIYRFETRKIKNKRKEWIKIYHVKTDRYCCIHKFMPELDIEKLDEQNENYLKQLYKKLDDLCICPKKILVPGINYIGYLCNYKDPIVQDNFSKFYIFLDVVRDGIIYVDIINMLTLNIQARSDTYHPNCSNLYRFLDSTNLEDFFFHFLKTTLLHQQKATLNKKNLEHELLYVTIENNYDNN
jgi:hypothetical protein